MPRISSARLNAQIYSEASEWFVNCRSGALDDATRRKFDAWLRQSPQHLSAYLELAAIWDEGPALDAERRWDTDTLIAEALADRSNVTTLITPSTVRPPAPISHARWAAVVAFMAIGLAAFVWVYMFREPIYITQIGEQRSITLPDGSTMELNSRSKVRVRYSDHERALELLEGQALFRVAKNPSRPFIVTSDGTRVRAVGTQFDVNKKREGTVVTVVEGRVSVLTDVSDVRVDAIAVNVTESMPQLPHESGAGAGILLAAGEQMSVSDKAAEKIQQPDVARAIAWTQKQLVFKAATLTEVAEEFNRYNQRQLIVQDPELYEFHISGVFASTDPGALLQFLRERAGVHVVESDSAIYLTKQR
ncbi:iron dicitrate transporter FecR [Steroidobacter agaridevorans]|uniref:Iron dicitrate transporter FecR n=1 Tax=Steroidobacter agaridevorans TaxID=2695856 RepID=A0A829YAY3_9GAMM|nr:FecR family protein [Steroidobacter agaridevorans]GFE80514.1 iron dicitrate transporter FecR [Steroidobacter agaridevorans]GFE87570.1 iron dicitrate transporter FecR [Steroidobacter agaridevorans]